MISNVLWLILLRWKNLCSGSGLLLKEKIRTISSAKNLIEERKERVKDCSVLCIRVNRTKTLPEGFSAGFVTSDGYTYKSPCPAPSSEGIIRIPLKDLRQTDTALLPIAYPTFLKQYFHPETEIAFLPERIEKLELSMSGNKKGLVEIELGNIWLE